MLLQPIDATDHGRFAGARWTANDNALATLDRKIDVTQHVKLAVPLVHPGNFDRDIVRRRLHARHGTRPHGGAGRLLCGVAHSFLRSIQRRSPLASRASVYLA
jgi:hypothetical protein